MAMRIETPKKDTVLVDRLEPEVAETVKELATHYKDGKEREEYGKMLRQNAAESLRIICLENGGANIDLNGSGKGKVIYVAAGETRKVNVDRLREALLEAGVAPSTIRDAVDEATEIQVRNDYVRVQ